MADKLKAHKNDAILRIFSFFSNLMIVAWDGVKNHSDGVGLKCLESCLLLFLKSCFDPYK